MKDCKGTSPCALPPLYPPILAPSCPCHLLPFVTSHILPLHPTNLSPLYPPILLCSCPCALPPSCLTPCHPCTLLSLCPPTLAPSRPCTLVPSHPYGVPTSMPALPTLCNQWRIQDFPQGVNPKGAPTYWTVFPQKLHENQEILARECKSLATP